MQPIKFLLSLVHPPGGNGHNNSSKRLLQSATEEQFERHSKLDHAMNLKLSDKMHKRLEIQEKSLSFEDFS